LPTKSADFHPESKDFPLALSFRCPDFGGESSFHRFEGVDFAFQFHGCWLDLHSILNRHLRHKGGHQPPLSPGKSTEVFDGDCQKRDDVARRATLENTVNNCT
jgi:hypothetical protein